MGIEFSACEAADRLYGKMKNDQDGNITRRWEYIKVFLKIAFQLIVKLISKLPLSPAGLIIEILSQIASFAADLYAKSNEDIEKDNKKTIHEIFSEEKAQKISSTIHSYRDRCFIFSEDKEKLCQEAKRYESKLFDQLNGIRFSMIGNPQNATVANLRAWLKGAQFHLEILSDMINLSACDASQVQRAADSHILTLNELVGAVKKQKTLAINVTLLLLAVRLTDKELGRSVCTFHPCFKTDAIKDRYLELLFKEEINPEEEGFRSIVGQGQPWAEFSKRFCGARDSQGGTVLSPAKTTAPGLVNLRLRRPS
ncbi:uncharacterized protein LOC144509133 [Mustelus asterias]